MGPQLGGRPGRFVRNRPRRPQFQGSRLPDLPAVPQRVHVLAAAALRALPQPGLRGLMPLRGSVQARRGRHRPGGPGALPGLALLRFGLPVQEGLFQLEDGPGREVHLLLPPHGSRPDHPLRPQLRGPHPLRGRSALRRRPHRPGSAERRATRMSTRPIWTSCWTRTTRRSNAPRRPGASRPT